LARVAGIDVLRALSSRDLPPHFDPGGKVVIPGNVSLTPLHLTGADLGCALGADQHPSRRGRGLCEAGKDLDPQPAAGQGPDPVETSLVEVDGGAATIDPDWLG
jgi:hypothetical protein